MKPVHKLQFGEVAPCGVDYCDTVMVASSKAGKSQPQSKYILRNYLWKNVTCKRCLKARKK